MSLLTDLSHMAKTTLDEKKSDDWFEKFEDRATEVIEGLPPGVAAHAGVTLKAIMERREAVKHLGVEGVTALVTHIGLGQRADAEDLLFLEKEASVDELLAASEASTAEVVADKDNAEARKQVAFDLLSAVGATAARSLLPVLIAL